MRKNISPVWLAVLITAGLLLLVQGFMWVSGGLAGKASAAKAPLSLTERIFLNCNLPPAASSLAAVRVERAVEAQLKAPATAKFGLITFAPTAKECRFRGVGTVDSQNSYGALIRTRFVGVVDYLPDSDSWRVVDVSVD
jgi:hypothetical protein